MLVSVLVKADLEESDFASYYSFNHHISVTNVRMIVSFLMMIEKITIILLVVFDNVYDDGGDDDGDDVAYFGSDVDCTT